MGMTGRWWVLSNFERGRSGGFGSQWVGDLAGIGDGSFKV